MRKEKLVVFLLLMLNVGIFHAQHPACGFSQQEISDSVFSRMYGKSFKAECTTLRSDLRCLRVLHCNVHGETLTGELVCHKDIADDLLYIFRKLYEARYPIERMVLIDEYNADGKNIKETYYNPDGTVQLYVIHEYDADGQYITTRYYRPDGTV